MIQMRTIVAVSAVLCIAAGATAQESRESAAGGAVPTGVSSDQPPGRVRQQPAGGRQPGRAHSFVVSGSAFILTSASLGTSAATMTSNSTGSTTPPFTYFNSSGQLATAPGFEGRIGYNITRALTVEGGITYSRPDVNFTISGDAENTPGFTAVGERLSQLFLDASVQYHLQRLSFAGDRGRTFLEGGVGYLRQVHEGATTADTGQVYHAGGGVKYLFSVRSGRLTGIGVRVDGRVYFTHAGFSFDSNQHPFAAIGGGIFLAF